MPPWRDASTDSPESGAVGVSFWTAKLMGSLVLIVDDSVAFRSLASRILESWGHEVIEADSAAAAVTLAVELHPHAVLVDIGLPDGNGFQLTTQLLGLPWKMNVVVVSTDSDAGNESAARRAGASGFFPKDQILSTAFRRLVGEG
jgi:CheY-like chemotaxis protein